jgi:serine/threonine-protein kinase
LLVGRYRLEVELGRTHVGAAWRATDAVLHRPVVVELVHPELSADPSFAARFAEETRALASIGHPGLARLLDAGSEDGVFFVVREDVEGRSLAEALRTDGPLPVAGAVEMMRAVLEALGEAHRAGVLHLDLEPGDFVVEPDGRPRLCETGIAAAVAGRNGATSLRPHRSAPEQAAGLSPDARTDVWGAGALLFELLTGAAPQEGVTSPRSIRRDVPRSVDAVVAKALAQDPAERHPSSEAFATALGEVATGLRPPAPAAIGAEPVATLRRASLFRTWLAVPLLVVALAVAAVLAGLSLGRLELGGPVGIRLKEEPPSPSPIPRVLSFASVRTWDPPPGDGHENDSGVELAIDGDPSTAWKSENYFDGELHKPGVGLLFDLGSSRSVTGFRLSTPFPGFGFEVLVGDDPSELARRTRGTEYLAEETLSKTLDQPVAGRYVLLWITSVVQTDDGNRAEVGEFHVLGLP